MKDRIELAEYFNKLGFKIGVEVGVAAGAYSEILCKAIPGVELFCVDPWDTYKDNHRGGGKTTQYRNYETAQERLKSYNTTLLRKTSMEAVKEFNDESLDFVYIDGNHDFDYVMEDIIFWSDKVRKGGIVAGHDYYNFNNSGVIEAVNAYTGAHGIKLNLTEGNKGISDDKQPNFWWIKP